MVTGTVQVRKNNSTCSLCSQFQSCSRLESASSVWDPGDISTLDKVEKRASKIPTSLKDLPYEKRVKIQGIASLEERKTRGDLIQTYKIVSGLESFDWHSYLQFVSDARTGAATRQSKRLKREVFPLKAFNYFCHFVDARQNINSFKPGLDSLPILVTKAYQAQ